MSGRVIVDGSVNVDLVAHAEHLPAPGETITGATFSEHDGGKGANQAVAAVRLGASTAFVGAVGRDAYGLRTVDGATGVALIFVDERGENMISVASGANAALTAANVTEGVEALAPTPH